MDPDNMKQAWQAQSAQTGLTANAERVLNEVQRRQHSFNAMIFWRDFREVGGAVLLIPLWLYLGVKNAHPWTWYLTVPVLIWIAAFMLADRLRHKRQPPPTDEPIRQHAESSLAQVEHQIWLLRNVHWWALLPMALSCLAFIGQSFWQERAGGWWIVLAVSLAVVLVMGVLTGVYWVNRYAVRCALVPRQKELETLLASLKDETRA